MASCWNLTIRIGAPTEARVSEKIQSPRGQLFNAKLGTAIAWLPGDDGLGTKVWCRSQKSKGRFYVFLCWSLMNDY